MPARPAWVKMRSSSKSYIPSRTSSKSRARRCRPERQLPHPATRKSPLRVCGSPFTGRCFVGGALSSHGSFAFLFFFLLRDKLRHRNPEGVRLELRRKERQSL
mmetsp:Transcript_1187/g.5019  ORF Transcript_1187/g.5019 Transcript_1187/m.5019 type:complete len:103 (+) Transcript_1187:575-883(+)